MAGSVGRGGEGRLGGDCVELGSWWNEADRMIQGYQRVEETEVVRGVFLHGSGEVWRQR